MAWRGWLATAVLCMVATAAQAAIPVEHRWDIRLEGLFRGGQSPLWLYGRLRSGKWLCVAGSSRDDARGRNKKSYNRSWYYGDFSDLPLKDGKLAGEFTLHITPDLWVPLDHKPYAMRFRVDAVVQGGNKMAGTWKLLSVGTKDTSHEFGRAGKLVGTMEVQAQPPLPDPVTFTCNMQGALIGGDPRVGDRCMVLELGFEGGKLTSALRGEMSQKLQVFARKAFSPKRCKLEAAPDRLVGRVSVPSQTLDMEPAEYIFEIDGRPLESYIVGTYKLTVKVDGQADVKIAGSFDGRWRKGIEKLAEDDDRPWFVPVANYQPPKPGEHPRLLFRRSDIPALRRKAKTPEGRAILARLRKLLNGGDGETMPTSYNDSTKAYERNLKKRPLPIGSYTMGHVAGYGLLYQVTGERKYADLGRQCFEQALAGVRDRDDRYSFHTPGGALRAGPAVGWYAVGYDLCYDGWDAKTREKLGRALADYEEGDGRKAYNLERLARGTMPPASNHFGMQVGGASLAILALRGEKVLDADRTATLIKIARQSMVRNVSEGFGDGGCFAEGDGTGSMASQIAYLPAVWAWRNAAGLDMIAADRPNVRMLTLKWVYQTVFRDGQPDFWPIRGAYGHNVWSRHGVSGAGYYGIGIGSVRPDEKSVMKWCYERFLLPADTKAGGPYDTVSPYPHHTVCAFVNWPFDLPPKPAGEVLPHCYRDTSCGFYCWRNRWQDGTDTVITVLTNRTRGYMSAKPDRALCLNIGGRHERWGTLKEGTTRYWSQSPRGTTSSLTLADGTCFAVDFTRASGADVMLVTTGKADGQALRVGGKALTLHFPTTEKAPKVRAEGNAAVVGKQRITIEDGHLVLGVQGR